MTNRWTGWHLRALTVAWLAGLYLLAGAVGRAAEVAPFSLEQAVTQALEGSGFEAARLTFEKARLDYEQAMATNAASPSRYAELVARYNLRQAETQLASSHFETVSSVLGAYLDVLSARTGMQLAELQVKRALATRDVAREKARSGAIGPVELQDAENQYSSARSDLSRAQISLQSALNRLLQLLGYPDPAPAVESLRLPETLPAPPELSEEQAVSRAFEVSQELAVRREAVEIARQQLEQAVTEQASPLTIRLRENSLRQAELAARQAELSLGQSTRVAYGQLQVAWASVQVAQAKLELERQRLEGLREQRQLGLKTDQDVLAGEIAVLRAEQEYVGAVKSYLTARVELNRLLGEPPGFGPATVLAEGPSSPAAAGAGEPGAQEGRSSAP